ncbi:hypothetical protein VTN49DRAFT_315 [Thermomyces lanuginosus]|uniref:uncharacterized protein n=1 Tax=Thermomyces lanuginosus TaxID=5541 RepID=UPI00374404D5
MQELFTIPFTGGTFVCRKPSVSDVKNVYILTFTSEPDNRLTPAFIDAFLLSLDIIQHRYPPGVVITTSGIPKFYSNGLDLELALNTEGFFEKYLYKLYRRLLTYPYPTIALINGHAFAGGFMLAMYHDYRVQNPTRGFLCLNEVFLGVPLKQPMATIYLDKISSATLRRDLMVEGKRVAAKEALEAGIIDAVGGLDEALALVRQRQLDKLARSPAYAPLKEGAYRRTLEVLDDPTNGEKFMAEADEKREIAEKEGAENVRRWEQSRPAKL